MSSAHYSVYPLQEHESPGELMPCTPFVVEGSVLRETFPGIDSFTGVLDELVEAKWVDESKDIIFVSKGLQPGSSLGRQHNRRYAKGIQEVATQYTLAAADFVNLHEDLSEGAKELQKTIYMSFLGHNWSVFADELVGDVYRCAQGTRSLQGIAAHAVSQMQSESNAGLTNAYELVKAFADKAGDSVDHRGWVAGQVLHGMDILQGSTLYYEFRQSLEDGQFDQHIAADIIGFVDKGNDQRGQYTRLEQFMRYSQQLRDAESTQERQSVYGSMVALISDWPPEIRQLVTDARSQLLLNLDKVNKDAREFITRNVTRLSDEPQKDMEVYYDRYVEQLSKIVPARETNKAAVMQARLGKRKRTSKMLIQAVQSEAGVQAEKPASSEPFKFARFRPSEANTEVTDTVIDDFVAEVMDSTRRTDDAFREDVISMLAFLRDMDPSQGNMRGIKKLNVLVTMPDGRRNNVWELKPLEATGLSTSTQAAKSMRLFFVWCEDKTIGLIDMMDRKRTDAYLYRLHRSGAQPPSKGNARAQI